MSRTAARIAAADDIEAIVVDTAPPRTPWPTAAGVPGPLGAPLPAALSSRMPTLTREDLNGDLAMAIAAGRTPLEAAAYIAEAYGVPFSPDFLVRAGAIAAGNDPTSTGIDPAAFGNDPDRLQVIIAPAGTNPNINNPDMWPGNWWGAITPKTDVDFDSEDD
jgi:hypothetical protein